MLVQRERACLLIIDMQERLLPAMAGLEPLLHQAGILIRAAKRLDLPILVSEQYPKGLGPTDPALRGLLGNEVSPLPKTHFSCADDPGLKAELLALAEQGRDQAVILGVEAHVCVLQTALGLPQLGLAPFVVADAVASRRPESRQLALDRMARDGVEIVTTEMMLFEWLGQAGTPEFKELSALIR
ncbi:MAG TPA: hydrolase [Hypericibacter adhaerens]|jgi:nicotinamidase-related amidase|nr:hydrolase [Hypericibacter adhaerens]HWA45967.1 hydrolase [Hypericibacter adhaerens]